MQHIACLAVICVALAQPQQQTEQAHQIQARVDPRVELMCVIFRLAGNPEYNQPNAKSPYADEVEAHFGKFRDHAVVRTAQRLRATRGVGYDAVMSMAVHLKDTIDLKEKIPFERADRLDSRWKPKEAREFLEQARAFVKETGFNKFFADHAELYATAADRMTDTLAKRGYIQWFDKFFGSRPGAEFSAIVGMLNGPCNYGCSVRYPDGREEICPVLGVWKFDAQGFPIIDDSIAGTVVHEFCHTYTNPLADKYADQLAPSGERIFPHCRNVMSRQAYGNWQTVMRETLVRVCVVRYTLAADGESAARAEIKRQHDRGFKWIGKLSDLLDEYESNRARYKSFDDFMPNVVAFFNDYAKEYEQLAASAPKIVSMTPPNGVTDVDPGLTEIKVFFDRPMKDKCWAVVGGGPHFPEITGEVSYDKDCKVLTVPVRLKAGWSYNFWLNRGKYDSFQSQEGVKLESVEVTFETRKR